jgi:hydrogenase expression/formation protein HypC
MCLAVPGKILTIDGEGAFMRTGKVDFAGVRRQVNLAYVPGVKIGDYVLVHVGFAISIIDEQEAQRVFDDLDELASSSHVDGAS